MTYIKPCPFCGGEAVATTNSDLDTYAAVRCTGCYIGTPHRSYGDATIEWNRRVDVGSLGIAHRFFMRRRKAKVPNGATITTVKMVEAEGEKRFYEKAEVADG